jgi:hypothetical protein
MSIDVRWYNEDQTEVQLTIVGVWTWDELFVAIDQTEKLMGSVEHTVNIILDMRQSHHVPTMLPSALRKVANAKTMTHRNSGLLILVGARSFVKSMFNIFSTLYPRAAEKYQIAESEEQLQAVLVRKTR